MTLAYANYCQLYIAFMQILIITHRLKLQVIFWISLKAFDKVWHEGLLYKLKSIGISGNLLNLSGSFLNEIYQRVVTNGQHSDWAPILASVPEGFIPGPLPFLIYINDLPANLNSLVKLFADNTFLFSMVHDPTLSAKILNDNPSRISEGAHRWKMFFFYQNEYTFPQTKL